MRYCELNGFQLESRSGSDGPAVRPIRSRSRLLRCITDRPGSGSCIAIAIAGALLPLLLWGSFLIVSVHEAEGEGW